LNASVLLMPASISLLMIDAFGKQKQPFGKLIVPFPVELWHDWRSS